MADRRPLVAVRSIPRRQPWQQLPLRPRHRRRPLQNTITWCCSVCSSPVSSCCAAIAVAVRIDDIVRTVNVLSNVFIHQQTVSAVSVALY